jgi:hypothetical protein
VPKPRKPLKPQPAPTNPVLAIDSSWDGTTKKVFLYRQEHVYPYISKRRLGITNLSETMARRCFFEAEVQRAGVKLITGMGHGDYDQFTGHLGDVIWEIGKYRANEVKNKIVHLLSCRTASKLGPDIVVNGALAFFGYLEDFVFHVDHESVFFQCASEIDLALADGLSVSDVHTRVKDVFESNIDELAGLDGQAAALLNANLQYLCTPVVDGRFGDRSVALR